MAIALTCDCGRELQVKDEYAGKRVRCPGCSQPLAVPVRPVETVDEDVEDAALKALMEDPGPEVRPNRYAPPPLPEVPRRPRAPDPATAKSEKAIPWAGRESQSRTDQFSPRRESKPRRSGVSTNPAVVIGILMMLGAVAWFVAGLASGVIFFYPPIMLVLGFISMVKGLRGQED